jgi:hypothetical protein
MMSDLHASLSSLSDAPRAEAQGLIDAFMACKSARSSVLRGIAAAPERVDRFQHSLFVEEEDLWQRLTAAYHALCGFLDKHYLDQDASWARDPIIHLCYTCRDAYGIWLDMRQAAFGGLE